MKRPPKNAAVKARVDAKTRDSLETIAAREQLDVSDLIRRAIREFLARNLRVN
ncbi:MAG: ribbon-helix-helix domain-containing protein [Verrucomicrobia bacterium]|nr:ribbon-helix-helix domain-containing protein [Verrucomicrobiota bacterium]